MVGFAALRTRFLHDTQLGSEGASPGLARALERVGWTAVQESTVDELASHLVSVVEACVCEHGDVALLERSIADLLRHNGPSLDGGLPPIDAYVPAAEAILDEYVAPTPRVEPPWMSA